MIRLGDREFGKLSEITGVSDFDLQKLYSIGLLNEGLSLTHIIKHDYNTIRRMGKYSGSQIAMAIAKKYGVTTSRVYNAMHNKKSRTYYCEICGKQIPKLTFTKNKGWCDDCVVDSIEV